MSRLQEKFLQDYSLDTLRDTDISSISDENIVVYDSSALKFINASSSALKIFFKRFFPTKDILVPSGEVLPMFSPIVDRELKIDGEVYIL